MADSLGVDSMCVDGDTMSMMQIMMMNDEVAVIDRMTRSDVERYVSLAIEEIIRRVKTSEIQKSGNVDTIGRRLEQV